MLVLEWGDPACGHSGCQQGKRTAIRKLFGAAHQQIPSQAGWQNNYTAVKLRE
jgi:hypothetical protein